MFLESKGYQFESETDTECIAKLISHIRRVSHIIIIFIIIIAKLISHIRSQNPSYTFRQLVEQTISQV